MKRIALDLGLCGAIVACSDDSGVRSAPSANDAGVTDAPSPDDAPPVIVEDAGAADAHNDGRDAGGRGDDGVCGTAEAPVATGEGWFHLPRFDDRRPMSVYASRFAK